MDEEGLRRKDGGERMEEEGLKKKDRGRWLGVGD